MPAMTTVRNPPLDAQRLTVHQQVAHQPAAHKFCWTGQLVRFTEGQKSPRQYLSIKVACVHYGDDALLVTSPEAVQSVRLSKSLRRMMMGYLGASDWLRVVGKCKIDAYSGEPLWKAQEIIKLSAAQVQSLELSDGKSDCKPQHLSAENSAKQPIAAKPPVRVLVCQQSSCRQRGSVAVGQVMEDALNASEEGGSQVLVQAVGCLKNCKLGPNVRVFSKEKVHHQGLQAPLKTHYEKVTPAAAKEIVDGLQARLNAFDSGML